MDIKELQRKYSRRKYSIRTCQVQGAHALALGFLPLCLLSLPRSLGFCLGDTQPEVALHSLANGMKGLPPLLSA